MVVRNARLAGMFLVVDEPNFGLRLVMLREPGAPFLAAGYIQRRAYFHFVLSAAVEDNDRRRVVRLSRRGRLQGRCSAGNQDGGPAQYQPFGASCRLATLFRLEWPPEKAIDDHRGQQQ